ncbi:MAG: hypothetical protein HeimC2_21140 [Candidatus Heimdallarchaeota archaeon LC_2]|nr:MAG: hypothetical protein HeimC2_21140 [Candidatus Heimdallarchaeota archaeon LC_2]
MTKRKISDQEIDEFEKILSKGKPSEHPPNRLIIDEIMVEQSEEPIDWVSTASSSNVFLTHEMIELLIKEKFDQTEKKPKYSIIGKIEAIMNE